MSNPRAAPPVTVMNGRPVRVSVSFTRPANTTQYAANDLVANDATAGSVVVPEFAGLGISQGRGVSVHSIVMRKTSNTLTDAQFRVHLFTKLPTVANGDNGALSIATSGDGWVGSLSGLLTRIAVLPANAKANGILTPDDGRASVDAVLESGATSLWALVEALDTYTPASAEVFTLEMIASPF